MKTYTITLATLLLFMSSCKNIEKMVDKGNYDEAISYGVKKLEGKKNKKTKYVKALEKAYVKVNNRDLDRIEKTLLSDNVARYDKVYDIYTRMEKRQNTVMRLDPLVSTDGYVAEFSTTNYNAILNETATLAAESHYNEALRLLDIAKTTDKYAARTAYEELRYIERYFSNYKNSNDLYTTAYAIGLDHISVEVYMKDIGYMSSILENRLYDLDVSNLNDFWTSYHIGNNTGLDYDYTATLEVDQIDPGFEREYYNTYEEVAKVEDGKKKVIDIHGNMVKDSTGQVVYTKKYKKVIATVTEMKREKLARIRGNTVIYHNTSKSLVKNVPLDITHHFEDFSVVYTGDKRALSTQTINKLKSNCDIFPSDYDMVMAMATDFKRSAYDVLVRRYR